MRLILHARYVSQNRPLRHFCGESVMEHGFENRTAARFRRPLLRSGASCGLSRNPWVVRTSTHDLGAPNWGITTVVIWRSRCSSVARVRPCWHHVSSASRSVHSVKGLPSFYQRAAHSRRRSAILGVMLKCSGLTSPSSAKRKQSWACSGERRRRRSSPATRSRACSWASASEMPLGTWWRGS